MNKDSDDNWARIAEENKIPFYRVSTFIRCQKSLDNIKRLCIITNIERKKYSKATYIIEWKNTVKNQAMRTWIPEPYWRDINNLFVILGINFNNQSLLAYSRPRNKEIWKALNFK